MSSDSYWIPVQVGLMIYAITVQPKELIQTIVDDFPNNFLFSVHDKLLD